MLLIWLLCVSGCVSTRAAGVPPEGHNLFMQHGCCQRLAHYVYVGHDLSGSPLSVDVGLCQARCGGLRRRNLLSDVPGLPKPSSMLEFLRAKKERFLRSPPGADREAAFPEGSCPAGSLCQASRTRVEEFSLMEGVRQVEVTEGCHCAPTPHECLRAPDPKTFFPDSTLEQTVDVGQCSSPPGPQAGLFCLPTHFDTVLVRGPNGHQSVETQERCGWRPPCYRVPHVQSYFEVVDDGPAGKTRERIKEIDVGRCLGKCIGSPCLYRGPPMPDKCRYQAEEGVPGCCTPHRYDVHTFRSRHGQLRTVLSIQTCGCGV